MSVGSLPPSVVPCLTRYLVMLPPFVVTGGEEIAGQARNDEPPSCRA